METNWFKETINGNSGGSRTSRHTRYVDIISFTHLDVFFFQISFYVIQNGKVNILECEWFIKREH